MSSCYICGSVDNIVTHHVRYDPEEVVDLCRACHSKVHHDPSHALYPIDPENMELLDGRDRSGVRPRIDGPVEETLDELIDKKQFTGYNEAIRHVLVEAGYEA